MGLETFSYVSTLNTANPTSSDAKSKGDDHLRGIKTALVNSFPAVASAVSASSVELSYVAGVTSAIQPQFTGKANKTGDTHTGTHDFTGATMTVATPTTGTNPVTKSYADNLAFSAALPSQTGNAGKFVTTDGTTASWTYNPTPPIVAASLGAL